jgi:hypothetical protein
MRTGAEVELQDSICGPDDTSDKPDPCGFAHRCEVGRPGSLAVCVARCELHWS